MSLPLNPSPITGSDISFDQWVRRFFASVSSPANVAPNAALQNWYNNYAAGVAANPASAGALWAKFAAPIITLAATNITNNPGDTAIIGAQLTALAALLTTYAGSITLTGTTVSGTPGAAPTTAQIGTILAALNNSANLNLINNQPTWNQPAHNATLHGLAIGIHSCNAYLLFNPYWFTSTSNQVGVNVY